MPPYCYVDTEETVAPHVHRFKWNQNAAKLMRMKDCCIFPAIRVWKRHLATLPELARGAVLEQLYYTLARPSKRQTLGEERAHSFQRSVAGGFDRSPSTFAHQVAGLTLRQIRENFQQAGGRDLSLPVPDMCRTFRRALSGRHVYPRPNQLGNPHIGYIGQRSRRTDTAGAGPRSSARRQASQDYKNHTTDDEIARP